MQAIKTFAEIQHELENYAVTLIFASPDEVLYQVETPFLETVLARLDRFSPKQVPFLVRGNYSYVSVPL